MLKYNVMKKRSLYTMLLAGSLIGGAGCTKNFLDTKIDTNATPETIITDRATLYTFANAFYAALPYGFNALDNNLFATVTDEVQQTQTSGNALVFNQGTLNANSNPDGNAYRNLYEGIRAANYYLDYSANWREFIALNRDTVADVTNYEKDKRFVAWYRAEAHVARAFYYSELIKRFGGVPLITKTLDQATERYVAKSSYEQIVDFIEAEVDKYKDSLQVNWKTSSYTDQDGRFTKGAALAIKARVLLHAASPLHNPGNDAGKWQKAAAAAREVMTTAGLNYALHTGGYGSYFVGGNAPGSNETILAIRRPADNNPEVNNYPIATPGGNSGLTPSQNLVADYEYTGIPDANDPYKNRDPRLAASIVTNGSTWNGRVIDQSAGGSDDLAKPFSSRTGYYLRKFLTDQLNLTQGGTAQHNWVLIRYAEVLLNYAEAMNEAYGPDGLPAGYTLTARQALKMVRDRASNALPAIITTSVPDFRQAVKHERRIELAFEDLRYWDLLRWKDAETVLNQPIQGVRVSKNANGSFSYQVVNVATRTFRAPAMYYYPFSQAEVVNSKGALEQNAGY
jgi:starch-binding outer membrane protein, SusD/RagB family